MKILVVEDEVLTAENIAARLTESGYEVTACVDNCAAALQSAQENPPDLVFLDIAIAGDKDGIETAKELQLLGDFPIIFLSNLYDEKTLQRTKAVKPAAYLMKPFPDHQLHVSIQQALFNLANEKEADPKNKEVGEDNFPIVKDTFFIKDSNGTFNKYHVSDILYIEADRAYCNIKTTSGLLMQTTNMKDFSGKINHRNFIKVHRSWIVNVEKIDSIKGNMVVIQGKDIPFTSEYKDDLMKHLRLVR